MGEGRFVGGVRLRFDALEQDGALQGLTVEFVVLEQAVGAEVGATVESDVAHEGLCWCQAEAVGAPDLGIAPGTKFEDLPEDFECPVCGVGKDSFSEA